MTGTRLMQLRCMGNVVVRIGWVVERVVGLGKGLNGLHKELLYDALEEQKGMY